MSPFALPAVLAWSPDRPYTRRTTEWNTGCPEGYFAEFVPRSAELATALPNGVEGVRCRLVTRDADVLAAEALSWEDMLLNLNAAILEATPAAAGEGHLLWWLFFGVLGLGVWDRMQTRRGT